MWGGNATFLLEPERLIERLNGEKTNSSTKVVLMHPGEQIHISAK